MTHSKITLHCVAAGWMAHFSGHCAAEVLAALGTTIVPTAYTQAAQPADVLVAIQRLNPGVKVVLA